MSIRIMSTFSILFHIESQRPFTVSRPANHQLICIPSCKRRLFILVSMGFFFLTVHEEMKLLKRTIIQ